MHFSLMFQLLIQDNYSCSNPRLTPSTLFGCLKFIKAVLEFPSLKTEEFHHANKFIFETKHAREMEGLLTDQGHVGMGHDGEDVSLFWWHLTYSFQGMLVPETTSGQSSLGTEFQFERVSQQ